MKINELSKELNITNKDLISYLRSDGFSVSSHMQNATEEMIEYAQHHFAKETEETSSVMEEKSVDKTVQIEGKGTKTFAPGDMIPCRSVTPWELLSVSADKQTVYRWTSYGDIEHVAFRDLQTMRSKDIIKKTKIIIEDPDLCYQWRRDLGETYKLFLKVEYPEEFFDLSDEKFRELLNKAPYTLKEVIKYTAMNMVRNENYPTIQKLNIVDEILGTCIKDFL